MTFTINSTLAEVLLGAGGILIPVDPTEKKEGSSPDYRGAIERQIKTESGYKTVARFEVSGWNTVSKDQTMHFVSLSVCGGLLRGALFKNNEPQGSNPPDASGTIGEKESGVVQIAARKTTLPSGAHALRLSVYQAQPRTGGGNENAAPPSHGNGNEGGYPPGYPF